MRKTLPILLLLATLLTTALDAAVSVATRFDPSTVGSGEYSSFVITLNGTVTGRLQCEPPVVDGLLISASPNVSNQVSVVNGDIKSFVRYIYTVRTGKPGTYTIPPFEATLNGEKCTVPGATLNVVAVGGETLDAFKMELELPDSMYVGETAAATLRILVRDDLRAVPGSITPKRSGDGFMQDPIDNSTVKEEHVQRGTTQYDGIAIPLRVTAIAPGSQKFTYDSDVEVLTTRASAGGIDELDEPLIEQMMQQMQTRTGGLQRSQRRALHATVEKTVDVKALPANPPEAFDGAVGTFEVYGNLSTHKTRVGEPVELTVKVLGETGLKQVTAPRAEESDDWRNYPPTEESETDKVTGKTIGKRFRFLFSPLKAGDFTTPSAHFAFFDPSTGRYVEKTISGELVHVDDVPGVTMAPQSFTPAQQQAPVRRVATISNDGFHPISLIGTPSTPSALKPPQKQPLFWLAQLIPALLIAWGIALPIMRKNAEKDPLAKQKKAFRKAAATAKTKAIAASKKGDASSFFISARKCLQNAVCAKSPTRKPETVSAADVVATIGAEDANLRRDTNLILNGSEALRYGGVTQPVVELAAKLAEIAKRLGVE